MGVGPTRSEATVEPLGGPAFEPLISRGGSEPGSFTGKDPFRGIPLSRSLLQERERGKKEKDTKSNDEAYLFWRGYYGEGEASSASPARGAACPAAELMRRGKWLAGRPLRVHEPFRGTAVPLRAFRILRPVQAACWKRFRPGLHILERGSGDGSSFCSLLFPLGFRNPGNFSRRREKPLSLPPAPPSSPSW